MTPTVRDYIAEQPAALARALAPLPDATTDVLRSFGPLDRVLIVGSGTSSYAAHATLPVLRETLGVDVEVYLPSDFLHYLPAGRLAPGTLVIAISQSGRSTGTLRSLQTARAAGASTLLLTGDGPRPGLEVDAVVDIRSGPEQVGAKTKGYLCTVATLLLVAAALAGTDPHPRLGELPALVAELLASSADTVGAAALDPGTSLSVLGYGPNMATALEASLKILETARVPVETFDVEEYLHGPHRRLTSDTMLVIVAVDGPVRDRAVALVDFARAHTRHILVLADSADGFGDVPVVTLPGGLPEELTPLLAIIPLQLLAVDLTERLGLVAEDPVFPDFHTTVASKEPQ